MTPFHPMALVDGYFLAHAVDFLYRDGILHQLAQAGATAETLAAARGLDSEILGQVLDFVRHRSGVLARAPDGRYQVLLDPGRLALLSHALDKYLGGYGPCVGALAAAARDPGRAGARLDSRRFAAAFAQIGRSSFPALPQQVRRFGVTRLLDIGCGAGGFLLEMAQADPAFAGWGVEPNPHALDVARRRAAAAGVSGRVHFLAGDALTVAEALPEGVAATVEAVSGVSLLNEFFHGGPHKAQALLRRLGGLFPGRLLFVADYYGQLGHATVAPAASPITLVHDFAQAVSGQGVPPPDGESWDAVYRAGGCERVARVTGDHDGLIWFIDTLRLAGPGQI